MMKQEAHLKEMKVKNKVMDIKTQWTGIKGILDTTEDTIRNIRI